MKKVLCITLALVLMLCAFVACSKSDKNSAESAASTDALVNELKTISDAVNLEGATYNSWAATDKEFLYVFELGGSTYRVIADFQSDLPDDFFQYDFGSEEGKQALIDTVGSCAITKAENLSTGAPAQEDLDAFVGKKGQDMLDAGYRTGGLDADNNTFYIGYGVYTVDVVVEDDIQVADEYDEEALFKDATIKSVTYNGIGDATYIEE